jgi:hypothetical protein
MIKEAHADVLDGSLNVIKNNAIRMLLVKNYVPGDNYATIVGKKLAEAVMASGDYVIASSGSNRAMTNAAKSATATAATAAEVTGTATSGSTTALNDTGKAWTVNEHAGRIVTITAGAGVGQSAKVVSNTATGLAFSAVGVALSSTSAYKIVDDLLFVHTNNVDKAYWITDETSNVPVASGATVNFPALPYTANQPT